jgi:hypothetical protein
MKQLTDGFDVKHYTIQDFMLRRKHKLLVGPDEGLRKAIMARGESSVCGLVFS